MNILLAVHHYPPRYKGGGEETARRLARGLIERGHRVRVVCVERIDEGPAEGAAATDELFEGVPVRRLAFDLRRAPDRFRWEYDNPWVAAQIRRLIAEERPDVLHLVGGYLLSGSVLRVARECEVPAVVRLTDFWFLCPRTTMLRSDGTLSGPPIDAVRCARCLGEESRRYRLPARLLPFAADLLWRLRRQPASRTRARLAFLLDALDGASAVLSPSQFLHNTYVAAGVDRARIHFVRQGIMLPDDGQREAPAGSLRLGYLGQIAPLKGVDVLLRAVRLLPDVRLTLSVYGDLGVDPNYAARLRRLAAGDPRIRLMGTYQDYGRLSNALRAIDALVVPSVWYENSPNVILEAYAHGIPVIASDLGGMAELVRHEESGLLFRPGDARDLARQIGRLASEPSLLGVLASGVPPVKTSAEEIDEHEGWYRRVVGAPPAARGRS